MDEPSAPAPPIEPAVRSQLLRLAREAVTTWVSSGRRIEAPTAPPPLDQRRGVFVTLTLGGELRGCIGHPLPVLPLGAAVVECAILAASEDPRFEPVSIDELPGLHLELSVLGLPRRVRPEEVVVGEHGILLTARGRRGLLLPQVAVEHGWNRETFLSQTCHKAGLDADAWRHGATIEVFSAEVFGEPQREA